MILLFSWYLHSSHEIITLWIAASVADTAAVNSNGIKTVLSNGTSIFFIKSNQVFCNGPKILPENPPGYPILCNWVFDNLILPDWRIICKNFVKLQNLCNI